MIAFDGSFEPPSQAGDLTPARVRTLAYVVTADGHVSDLAVRAEPFVAPEGISKVGYGDLSVNPPEEKVVVSVPG